MQLRGLDNVWEGTPGQCEACKRLRLHGRSTGAAYAYGLSTGQGEWKATLSTTTPVAGHLYGGSTIQQYESLAVQQVLRALLRPPRASVGGLTGSAGRCCHGEVYTTSRSCQDPSECRRAHRECRQVLPR